MSTYTEKILEYLQIQAENTADLLATIFSSRPVSYGKMRHTLKYGPPQFQHDWADMHHSRQRFYSLLNHLKRDGLVMKRKQGGISVWRITTQGLQYLARSKKQRVNLSDLPKRDYQKKKAIGLIIIAFDVPEKERRKRDWLRANLIGLGFTKLQHSVWMGKVEIPEDFMTDLRTHNMISYVHIFSVNKMGSIIEIQ